MDKIHCSLKKNPSNCEWLKQVEAEVRMQMQLAVEEVGLGAKTDIRTRLVILAEGLEQASEMYRTTRPGSLMGVIMDANANVVRNVIRVIVDNDYATAEEVEQPGVVPGRKPDELII